MMQSIEELVPNIRAIGLLSDMPETLFESEKLGTLDDFEKNKDNSIYIMLIKNEIESYSYCSFEEFKKVFNLARINNNVVELITRDLCYRIRIPLENSLGKKLYNENEIKMIQAHQKRSLDFIPDELRDKYCICFGNKILEYTDTLEEAKKIANSKYTCLSAAIINPSNKNKDKEKNKSKGKSKKNNEVSI